MKYNKPLTIQISSDGFARVICSEKYRLRQTDIVAIVDHQGRTEKIVTLAAYEDKESISYKINDSGYYFARAEIIDAAGIIHKVECAPTLFILERRQNEISNLLASKGGVPKKIPYFLSPYPQIDFLVDIGCKSNNHILRGIDCITGVNFYVSEIEIDKNKIKIYSSSPVVETLNCKELFSGYAWHNSTFFFGCDSWYQEKNSIKQLKDNLGNYSYLKFDKDCIEIGTDYLGFSRLFYYSNGDSLFISNRYHLLLLFIKDIGLPLGLNEKRIENLFLSNVTLFRQIMTHDLLVDNTHLLPSYKFIRYSSKGVEFVNKPLFDLLSSPVIFDEKKYNEIVNKAAVEIKDNIRSTLTSSEFHRVVVDLSGGRDSRVGYAALTNLEEKFLDKVRIRSTLHEPDDLNIAIQVNNVFGYPYFDEGDVIEPIDPLVGLENKRSYYLGYHFLWYCPVRRHQKKDQIRLTGESFEALSVRYYSNVLRDPCGTLDIDTLINEFLKILSRQCVLDFESYGYQFANQLAEVLEEIPGISAQEKFDALFLLFRGSFHAGNLDRMHYEPACCMPLQSKNLILAKRMWQSIENYNRVIYDIIYLLNPVLSIIPYNSEKTNIEFLSHRDEMFVGKGNFKSAYLNNITSDIKDWDSAYNKKNSRDSLLQISDDLVDPKMLVGESDHTKRIIREQLETRLSSLYTLNHIFPENWQNMIFMPLYWYVNDFTRNDDEIRVCHHKISMLYDIAAIIFEERKQE